MDGWRAVWRTDSPSSWGHPPLEITLLEQRTCLILCQGEAIYHSVISVIPKGTNTSNLGCKLFAFRKLNVILCKAPNKIDSDENNIIWPTGSRYSHIIYLGKCTSIAIHFPALESSSETHSGCVDYLQEILGSTENYWELLGSDMKSVYY